MSAVLVVVAPLGWVFERPSESWREALESKSYFFLSRWAWYEWLGAIAPLVLFGLLAWWARRRGDVPLARFAIADLFLDTLPYNAHTVASDALWGGCPLVTCAGQTFASRVAGSLLRAVGLPELAVTSLADYEALAKALL